nr:serine hydrolase domain-containing protein [Clostridia bacterium]
MKNVSVWARRALIRRRNALEAGLTPVPSGSPEGREWQDWLLKSMGALLQSYGTVGASVAMAYKGRVIAELAFGEAIQGGAPAAPDTKYRIASISKMLGSLAVMRLVEEGTLSLDADVSDLLGFPVRNPRWPLQPVTLRQLMTHTSGLRDTGDY